MKDRGPAALHRLEKATPVQEHIFPIQGGIIKYQTLYLCYLHCLLHPRAG